MYGDFILYLILNIKYYFYELLVLSKLIKWMMILFDISYWEILVDWFVIL